MRRLLLTAAAAATLTIGPGAALALAHGSHHHKAHTHRVHSRTEHFVGDASAPAGSTGATGATGAQPPAPETAGMVVSFSNGVLTLKLNDGTTVSGTISDSTSIDCAGPAGNGEDGHDNGNDNSDNGDNSGRGNGDGGGGPGGGHGDDERGGAIACTVAAVTTGTLVAEAELHISNLGSVWESLELVA